MRLIVDRRPSVYIGICTSNSSALGGRGPPRRQSSACPTLHPLLPRRPEQCRSRAPSFRPQKGPTYYASNAFRTKSHLDSSRHRRRFVCGGRAGPLAVAISSRGFLRLRLRGGEDKTNILSQTPEQCRSGKIDEPFTRDVLNRAGRYRAPLIWLRSGSQ